MEDRICKINEYSGIGDTISSLNDESMSIFKMEVNKVYLMQFDGKDHKGLIICVYDMSYQVNVKLAQLSMKGG